jgi:hypothetical protein
MSAEHIEAGWPGEEKSAHRFDASLRRVRVSSMGFPLYRAIKRVSRCGAVQA